MFPPIVTLTTDFGLSDHYVGAMKGVILSRCPRALIVDISHEVPAFSILPAAYTIDQAARHFPMGTVHVVVVDPGVGTERKPLLIEAHGSSFIAPDNGVLSLVLARAEHWTARELTNRALWLPDPSATFHGRDVFAPVAAALAADTAKAAEVGPMVENPVVLAELEPHATAPHAWQGIVLSVDHFGNVITNFGASRFASATQLEAGAAQIRTFHKTFGEAAEQQAFIYRGSSGYLEIGVNGASAAKRLGVRPGDRIGLRLSD